MAQYNFEFKLAIVHEYLEGKGGLGYLAKKTWGELKKPGTRMDQCLSRIWRRWALA